MGCTASVPEVEDQTPFLADKRIDDAISQKLQLNHQNKKSQMKLLLLGAGESGKSTVLKQLRLLHKGGFTDQERVQYGHVIRVDALQSIKILIEQAAVLKIPLDCDKRDSALRNYKSQILRANVLQQIDTTMAGGSHFLNEFVLKYSAANKLKRRQNSTGVVQSAFMEDELDQESVEVSSYKDENVDKTSEEYSKTQIAEAIHMLWTHDKGIQQCFERSNEFQLESNAQYYFEKIYDFAKPNYVCTNNDILKGRIKTTGITETNFNISSYKFKILDAGGQRLERKKWIHCFDNITAILFVLALSEYDQTLFEDEKVNRMQEALVLFDTLCNLRWFTHTSFIVFLNKMDLFERKFSPEKLQGYFPEFSGSSVDDGVKFFEQKLLGLNRGNKSIYIHRTCATDTLSMKFVLSAVTDMIIDENLRKSGLI